MPAERPRLLVNGSIRRHRAPARAALAFAAALALAPAARAQTLEELLDAARGYDAAYLGQRAVTESAIYNAAQREALMRPSAALTGSANYAETKLPSFDSYRSGTQGNLTVTGRQPLFNRANNATIDQAYKSLALAQYDLSIAEQDLILRLSQAYFEVLAAQDTLATARTAKAAISEQLASAKRNFEVGTATITDTREAQARFDLATAQEIAAENELRTKRIALDQLVGRTGVEPRGLATPVVLPPLEPLTLDDWVARADTEHPNVQRARLALDIASLETAKARAGHLPTLDAVATLSDTRNGGGISILPGFTRSAGLGVQLNLPLFSGFAVQNRVKETLLLEDKARNDLNVALRAVAQATRQLYYSVSSLQAQVKALEAAESSSQLALEATQLGYRVGVRVNLDVLNSQNQLFTTRRDLAKARYDVLLAALRLRQASGRLLPADVAALTPVLARPGTPGGAAPSGAATTMPVTPGAADASTGAAAPAPVPSRPPATSAPAPARAPSATGRTPAAPIRPQAQPQSVPSTLPPALRVPVPAPAPLPPVTPRPPSTVQPILVPDPVPVPLPVPVPAR